MSTIFIAVQCCQCSTMQVKQKRKSKSISKWSCVVCNQKQSLRKVFAQGFMAKDLRSFVQSFNMSRSLSDDLQAPPQYFNDQEEIRDDRLPQNDREKRRSDWSEYLDSDELDRVKEEDTEGGDFETEIVTELPEAMFKKRRRNNCSDVAGDISKTNFGSQTVVFQGEEHGRYQPVVAKGSSKGNENMAKDATGQKRKVPLLSATGRRASKWNDYINEDDDDLKLESKMKFGDYMGGRADYALLDFETITDDQKVEDDVHPDFIV